MRLFATVVLAGALLTLPASAATIVLRLAHVVIVSENHERGAVLA